MSQNCRQKSEADRCLSIVTVILHAGRVQHWSFPGNLVTGAITEDNICKVRPLHSPAHPPPAGDSLACLPAWWDPFCYLKAQGGASPCVSTRVLRLLCLSTWYRETK